MLHFFVLNFIENRLIHSCIIKKNKGLHVNKGVKCNVFGKKWLTLTDISGKFSGNRIYIAHYFGVMC